MAGVKYKVGNEEYTADELVALGVDNPDLFYQIFFSKTVRQQSAPFHLELDSILEDPSSRYVLAKMFRGSAKTTRLRMYTGRRIAYGLSHTILYVGASEGHATRSIKWLRRQVEFNKPFAQIFGLVPGSKWQETELEIISKITGDTCWVLGAGITGNIRGINFDDYRPDLIICDDVITDENAATLEQRDKIFSLLNNALKNSLTPATEDPNSKMILAQTPMDANDSVARIEADPTWKVLTCPIWTRETIDLPTEQQESVWPERFPSETIRADKRSAAATNTLSGWVKENEVRLINSETSAFKSEWLQILDIMPRETFNILSIDPVPPPSNREVKKGLKGKDFEAIGVIGRLNANYYVKDYEVNRGHDPSWTVSKVFELAAKHKITQIVVEGIAYQKTLKWILEQEMRKRQMWYMVFVVSDRRPKYHKIIQALNGVASQSRLFCHRSHTEFIDQFNSYGPGYTGHDDVLDMVAQGLTRLINPVLEIGADLYSAQLQDGTNRYKVPKVIGCP